MQNSTPNTGNSINELTYVMRWYKCSHRLPPKGEKVLFFSTTIGRTIESHAYPELLRDFDWWTFKPANPRKLLGDQRGPILL